MSTELGIEATGLAKSYCAVHALDGVDLSVPRGTVLGLLGPNGAGKTTAVRILTTLLKPGDSIWQALAWSVGLIAIFAPSQ